VTRFAYITQSEIRRRGFREKTLGRSLRAWPFLMVDKGLKVSIPGSRLFRKRAPLCFDLSPPPHTHTHSDFAV
jgi:hypothetical protein